MLAAASNAGVERDAYAIGVEELISVWADELDLAGAEPSTESLTEAAGIHTAPDNIGEEAQVTQEGSRPAVETDDDAHPRPHRDPAELSEREAVLIAYADEIDLAASYLEGGLSVMLGVDRPLIEHLAAEIAVRSGRAARFVVLPSADPGGTRLVGTRGGRRAELITVLNQAMDRAGSAEVLVIPSFDLLVGGSNEMLDGQAIDVVDLLYEHSDKVILAFTDMSKVIPEVLANRFATRLAIDILPRTVRARDGSTVPIGRALVTEAEVDLFTGFDPVVLYKYIAGMNAVRLRRAMRFACHQYTANGTVRPTFANLLDELRMFKARNSAFFEVPYTSFDDIGGYREVKDELSGALRLIAGAATLDNNLPAHLRRELIPRGFIFHGPRGTGKTLFANAMARELWALVRVIPGSKILGQETAVTEHEFRNLFTEAGRNAPAVLVFDDIDLIAAQRVIGVNSNESSATNSVIAQLLSELDGLRPEIPVLVIGTTSRLDVLDEKLLTPGRFKPIKIGVPEKSDRREIALLHARHFDIAVGDELLETVAGLTDGMTGADIRSVFRDARAGEVLDIHNTADAARLIELIGMLRNSRQ